MPERPARSAGIAAVIAASVLAARTAVADVVYVRLVGHMLDATASGCATTIDRLWSLVAVAEAYVFWLSVWTGLTAHAARKRLPRIVQFLVFVPWALGIALVVTCRVAW